MKKLAKLSLLCDNEIDSLGSIKHRCLASSVCGERLAMIVVGNGK
jgi:hypothetical protein